jgi:hypothetical protein
MKPSSVIVAELPKVLRKTAEEELRARTIEYQSDFARSYVAQGKAEGLAEGKAEGLAEGKAEGVLTVLGARGIEATPAQQALIRQCTDLYQVRLYTAWYRYVTLAMLALAWLAVTRASLAGDGEQVISTANEIRRMFAALCGPPPDEQHARRWSRWRHRHQQRARHCHYQRQRLQDR